MTSGPLCVERTAREESVGMPRALMVWDDQLRRVALLSIREYEVFVLLGFGDSNRTAAQKLCVAERTVKAHVTRIMAKLMVESRLQAGLVSMAMQIMHEGAIGGPGGNRI